MAIGAITVILAAVVLAIMEKHFITLGIFALLWGIISLIVYMSGHLDLNSGLAITLAVGVVFLIVEGIRRKLDWVNLKM